MDVGADGGVVCLSGSTRGESAAGAAPALAKRTGCVASRRGGNWLIEVPFVSNRLALRDRCVEAGSPSSALPDMRNHETSGIERRHGGFGDVELVVCSRPTVALGLKIWRCDEKRRGRRARSRSRNSVGQSGHHRHAMQPGIGVGAKLGAVFMPSSRKALRADALVCAQIGLDEDEAAVGSAPSPDG